jgi:hypothetical protein
MALETDGYISPDIAKWVTKNRAEHEPWFGLAVRLNRVSQRHMLAAVIPDSDNRSLLVLLFFARALSSFQGAILLAERGMTSEAQTLARSCLETSFYIGAVANDVEFIHHLVRSDTAHKKKVASWLTSRDAAVTELSHDQIEKVKGFLDNLKSSSVSASPIVMKRAAEKAQLADIYETVYRDLSDRAAHPSLNSLLRHIRLDASGNVIGLTFGPDANDIEETILAMNTAQFCAVSVMARLFPCDECNPEIDACWETHKELISRRTIEVEAGLVTP